MANYLSTYSGEQIDNIIGLFHNKGLNNVQGIVQRDASGNFSVASIDVSPATSATYGTVKIGYTTNNNNYGVQLSNGQMYVNVPWSTAGYINFEIDNDTTSNTFGNVICTYISDVDQFDFSIDQTDGILYVEVENE